MKINSHGQASTVYILKNNKISYLVIVATSSSHTTFGAKFNFAQIRGDKSMDNSGIILTWRFVKNPINIRHKDGQISSNLNCNPGCQAIVVLKYKNIESSNAVYRTRATITRS